MENHKNHTEESWLALAENLHHLIIKEMERASDENILPEIYPNLVVMYEFFRFIRGESFRDTRPVMGDKQKELYRMEDEIGAKLSKLKEKLNPEDERTRRYLDLMKKSFDL